MADAFELFAAGDQMRRVVEFVLFLRTRCAAQPGGLDETSEI